MLRLEFEPRAAGWKEHTDPLIYVSRPISPIFYSKDDSTPRESKTTSNFRTHLHWVAFSFKEKQIFNVTILLMSLCCTNSTAGYKMRRSCPLLLSSIRM